MTAASRRLPANAPAQCRVALTLAAELVEAKRISNFEAEGLRKGVWPLDPMTGRSLLTLADDPKDSDEAQARQSTAFTPSDFLSSVHQNYAPAALGAVTQVNRETGLGGVSFVTSAGEHKFLVSSEEMEKLVLELARYLTSFHHDQIMAAITSPVFSQGERK